MPRFTKQDIIHLLKLEASIIEGGNFGRPVLLPWRGLTVLRDCLSCLNVAGFEDQRSCGSCFLLDHVPKRHRRSKLPCHHIPLNEKGDTIADLDRRGEQNEAPRVLLNWIRDFIKKLEEEPD
jgi:hypothetical protein